MDRLKLIYIAPSGYSGSTLLDLLLNNHSQIRSMGEVMFWDEWIDNDLLCSCRERMSDCPFWNAVRQKLGVDFRIGAPVGAKESLLNILDRSEEDKKEYANQSYRFMRAVQDVSGHSVLLDSSKSVGRLKMLALCNALDIYVLHLVRNGRAVLTSGMKKKERLSFGDKSLTENEGAIKASMRWYLANKNLEKICKKKKIKRLLIKYEDIVNRTEDKMREICNFIELPFENSITKLNNEDIHNISGSRWRYKRNLKIKKNMNNTDLSLSQDLWFSMIGGGLQKKYKY